MITERRARHSLKSMRCSTLLSAGLELDKSSSCNGESNSAFWLANTTLEIEGCSFNPGTESWYALRRADREFWIRTWGMDEAAGVTSCVATSMGFSNTTRDISEPPYLSTASSCSVRHGRTSTCSSKQSPEATVAETFILLRAPIECCVTSSSEIEEGPAFGF